MDYQDTPTAGFVEYMQDVENAPLREKFKLDPDYITTPHDSPEGGRKTTAFGHKLKGAESYPGLTQTEANDLLREDIGVAFKATGSYVDKNFGEGTWRGLPQSSREALTDYQYNLKGGVASFPSLTKAVIDQDQPNIVREFRRGYTDKDGVKKDLSRRNQKWWQKFGRPMTGVKYQQTASVAKTLTDLEASGVNLEGVSFK